MSMSPNQSFRKQPLCSQKVALITAAVYTVNGMAYFGMDTLAVWLGFGNIDVFWVPQCGCIETNGKTQSENVEKKLKTQYWNIDNLYRAV